MRMEKMIDRLKNTDSAPPSVQNRKAALLKAIEKYGKNGGRGEIALLRLGIRATKIARDEIKFSYGNTAKGKELIETFEKAIKNDLYQIEKTHEKYDMQKEWLETMNANHKLTRKFERLRNKEKAPELADEKIGW